MVSPSVSLTSVVGRMLEIQLTKVRGAGAHGPKRRGKTTLLKTRLAASAQRRRVRFGLTAVRYRRSIVERARLIA